MTNEEVLRTVNEERNILHTIKRRKVTWVGLILRRNLPSDSKIIASCVLHILTFIQN